MQSAAAAPSPSPSFAGLLADLAAPEKKFPPARASDGLADDIVALSYEHALRAHARYRPSEPMPALPKPVPQASMEATLIPDPLPFPQAPFGWNAGSRPILAAVPARTPEEIKSASVTVRLTQAENEQLRKRAAEANITISAYLRSCAFEVESLRAQVKETLAELRRRGASAERRSWWRRLWPGRTPAAASTPGI
ncbi:MAG TPA: hypothetical protein VG267_09135 [Terracidiphilus sp.]|jgi:hypothetical protein|nr:hypothetical protein [Terracidiphilus sp.]